MTSTDKRLHFSESFVISCGTVTMDSKKGRILLIRWRKTGEYLLPKGRKNIDETLNQAALRETYEETGVLVQPLPVKMEINATIPLLALNVSELLTEPFAITQRVTEGKLKLIFWYIAQGDSTKPRVEGTQQENEEFDTIWVPYDTVVSTLSFDDDQKIVDRAISLAQATNE